MAKIPESRHGAHFRRGPFKGFYSASRRPSTGRGCAKASRGNVGSVRESAWILFMPFGENSFREDFDNDLSQSLFRVFLPSSQIFHEKLRIVLLLL